MIAREPSGSGFTGWNHAIGALPAFVYCRIGRRPLICQSARSWPPQAVRFVSEGRRECSIGDEREVELKQRARAARAAGASFEVARNVRVVEVRLGEAETLAPSNGLFTAFELVERDVDAGRAKAEQRAFDALCRDERLRRRRAHSPRLSSSSRYGLVG